MTYFISFIIGVIQGITEFFPVSSSGHTLLLYAFLQKYAIAMPEIDIIVLQVVIHFGTLLAILFYFRQELIQYIEVMFKLMQRKSLKPTEEASKKAIQLIIVGILPIAILGLLLQNFVEETLHEATMVPVMLIVVAILFFIVEKKYRPRIHSIEKMTYLQAFTIGCAQVLALIPGTSRSGITLIAGMFQGVSRTTAASFTFLMAIPTLLGVTLKKMSDIQLTSITSSAAIFYLMAGVTSAVIGFFAIKYLLELLKKYSLNYFGIYRIILAVISILLLW